MLGNKSELAVHIKIDYKKMSDGTHSVSFNNENGDWKDIQVQDLNEVAQSIQMAADAWIGNFNTMDRLRSWRKGGVR
jgi:hypothetical protein